MKISSNRLAVCAVSCLALLAWGCGGGGGSDSGGESTVSKPAAAPTKKAPAAAAPEGSSTVRGVVNFEGQPPKMRAVKMDADAGCAKKHSSPVKSEALVLGEGQTMGNVFVQIKSGLPGGSYAPPSEPVVLDQEGCRYVPHVTAVMAGQPLKILNSDGLLHNVHALPKVNSVFNMAMPASRTEAVTTFDKAESMFKIKCDVHPWMSSFLAVVSHPYFDVTATDGKFEIPNLPAGTYEIEAWHERLGTKIASVTVADGESTDVGFTFSK